MFPKKQRYSFSKGYPSRSLSTEHFSLRYQKNNEGRLSCAVIVANKVDKRSVVRHRLKRRFIHALKEVLENKDFSYDLVFFLKKKSQDLESIGDVKASIKNVLEKKSIV